MRIPCNDMILIEPIEEKTSENEIPVYTPERAKMMQPAKVVAIGNDSCVINSFDKGISGIVKKSELIPGLKVGATVYYRKVAEDRTTMDAAYRQKIDDRDIIAIKITDILAIEP